MVALLPQHAPPTALDALLPRYDFGEEHTTLVHAPPQRVFAALREITPADLPLMVFLMSIRSLPTRLAGARSLHPDKRRPLLETVLAGGFTLLAEEPDRELVIGFVGQPWKLRGGSWRPVRDGRDFIACAQPGLVKVATNFLLQAEGDGTRLATATRILVADPASRRAFGRYWLLIRPGSGLIRREWLRAVERRAERAEAGRPG